MVYLIAQGFDSQHRWKRALPVGEMVVLGRGEGNLAVTWDKKVSRQHAELIWQHGALSVRRIPTSRNVINYRNQEASQFQIKPGEHFQIGETTFTLVDDRVPSAPETPPPAEQRTYAFQEIQAARYRDADFRIDVLSRLPSLISGAGDDDELFVRLVNMLLAGISRSDGVALVAMDSSDKGQPRARVLHWDRRRPDQSTTFRPSEQLILEAIRRGQSVSYVWSGLEDSSKHPEFTMTGGIDWSFCTPVGGPEAEGWAIYVFGKFGLDGLAGPPSVSSPDLLADLKFTELVASILAALRQVRRLQRKQAALSKFFSPVVIESLTQDDPEVVLAPRQTNVSVLFCDLRGFSLEAERNADDLMGLLERVSQALGVMTYHIMDQSGVVGDFQGDAAMGFWGWPIDQGDSARRACVAAIEIRSQFEANAREQGHPLANFNMGIGIASGSAVAGKIGTTDQAKVSVFGPVVNLASRLQDMTKMLHAPILMDEATARLARVQLPPDQARLRRLARVKPYGLDLPQDVTELLPPEASWPQLRDEHIKAYESALESLKAGRWPEALSFLSLVPSEDQVKDFITVFIAENNRTPPVGWDGVIPLPRKK